MSNEQIAHDLSIAIIQVRGIDTPKQALEEYQTIYKDILHRLST